jgi:ribosomal protein S18 acetylase RimI-like enzyme
MDSVQITFSPVRDEAASARVNALADELYLLEGLPMDDGRQQAILELVQHPEFGGAWLILADGAEAGFVVLTACYSLEFHGRFGLLDEFYLAPPFRSKGIGSRTLEFIDEECRSRGWQSVRLEVAVENLRAQELYRRAGYRVEERHLMTKCVSGG